MYGKALEILPMKAWKLPKGKEHMRKEVCGNGKYFGQVKKDGYWYQFEKDMDGNCFLFSRVPSKETGHLSEKSANVPHIINHLNERLPNGTIIVGEIYYPNKRSKDVTPIMGSLPEKAVSRQLGDYGLIHFYMHDILMYDGVNYVEHGFNNIQRYEKLQDVVTLHSLTNRFFIEFARARFDTLDMWIDELIEAGEEGAILKSMTGKYEPDKKPAWNWIKFKIEEEHDVICIGYEPPTREYKGDELKTTLGVWNYWQNDETGEMVFLNNVPNCDVPSGLTAVTKTHFHGWIGAIQIGVYKGGSIIDIGTVHSGLNEELLGRIKAHPTDFIGEAMLVKCMNVEDNALRHGAFIRFRDDIPAKDCTWEKIFE